MQLTIKMERKEGEKDESTSLSLLSTIPLYDLSLLSTTPG
jgi:hypothetical protein